MELVLAIALIVILLIGVVLGLLIPFLLKRYIDLYLSIIDKKEIEESKNEINKTNENSNLTPDIIDEWQNGKIGGE